MRVGSGRRSRTRAVLAGLVSVVALLMVAPGAQATISSHRVAYVFDDGQFPCGSNGCGINDTSGPGYGASIFVNALDGTPPGSGDTGTYTPASGGLGQVNLTNVPFSAINANSGALAGYDTVIAYEPCAISQNPTVMSALNTFVGDGGKLLLFDADACASSSAGQADWSTFLFPFATDSPGPQGASGSYTTVIPSELTAGLATGTQPDDSVGDANVFTTFDGRWYESVVAQNQDTTGIVQAYATAPSGGLVIYDGEDFWYTDGVDAHLQQVFDNMLSQPWSPSGLPNTITASGIQLAPTASTATITGRVPMTVTVADPSGSGVSGAAVSVTVISGPDHGETVPGTTGASGQATLLLVNHGSGGVDAVQAHFVDSGTQTHSSNQATVTWKGAACRGTFLLGARGSGETDRDFGGYGHTIASALTAFDDHAARYGLGPVTSQPLHWASFGVEVMWKDASLVDPTAGLRKYLNGVNGGIVNLDGVLHSEYAVCPHRRVVLVGYSQGALVIDQELVALGHQHSAILRDIKAVGLISDPHRLGTSGYDRGTASRNDNGISRTFNKFPGAQIPRSLNPRILSFCDRGDAICGVDKRHLISELKSTKTVHTTYWKSVSGRIGAWLARVAAR